MSTRLQQLQEMLKSEPGDSFLNYALALEYANSNEIQKAIGLIENLLHQDSNYLGAYYQLGKYYEQVNEQGKAITTYQNGISVAKAQNNKKAESELSEALLILNEE